MNDQIIDQEIQAKGLTAPRVTPADIEANIVAEYFFTAAHGVLGAMNRGDLIARNPAELNAPALQMLTFCVLQLRNGTRIVGTNYGAIDPAQHSAERGRADARAQAVEQIWPLMGYALRERLAAPVVSASFLLNDTPEQESDLLEKLRKAPSSGIFLTALDSDAGKAVAALLQAAEAKVRIRSCIACRRTKSACG